MPIYRAKGLNKPKQLPPLPPQNAYVAKLNSGTLIHFHSLTVLHLFSQTRRSKNRLFPFLPRPKANYSLQVHIPGTSAVSKRNSLINMLQPCRKTPLSLKHAGDTPGSAKNLNQKTFLGRSCTAATWRKRWVCMGRLTRSQNTVPYTSSHQTEPYHGK